jgi:hypothetical protein
VSPELALYAEEMRLHRKYKYVTFTLKNTGLDSAKKAVWAWEIVDAVPAAPAATSAADDDNVAAWQALSSSLPKDSAVFTLFDWACKASDGRRVNKVILVKWCPDTAPVAQKMMFGSTHEALRRSLPGLARDLQAADAADVVYEAVARSVMAAAA